jgi:transposase-like protein
MKKLEKMKAIELRKIGYSLNEIVSEIGVSKSTISMWVRNVFLSKESKIRLLTKITAGQLSSQESHRAQRIAKENAAKQRARIILNDISFNVNISRLICALLYFCEGRKSPYSGISFMNSDPGLMKLFLTTLRTSFSLDETRFRVQVHLHSYHDKNVQLKFWSKIMNIPIVQFIKPYQKKSSGLYKKDGYQGCVNVQYHDVTISRELRMIAQEYIKQQP